MGLWKDRLMAFEVKQLIYPALAIALVLGGTYYMNNRWESRYEQQNTVSNELRQLLEEATAEIKTLRKEAEDFDKRESGLREVVKEKDAETLSVKQQLALLKRGYTPLPGLPDSRDAIISKQDELITSLEGDVQTRDTLIAQLTTSRDNWKDIADSSEKALEIAQRQIVAERLAKEAAARANKSSRWLGRLEGFGVGLLAGYAKGKM